MDTKVTSSTTHELCRLGEGGMGEIVLVAEVSPAGTSLAVVKRLKPECLAENGVELFLEEARLAAQLHHPHVVQTFDLRQNSLGQYELVMEYLDGQPLNRVLGAVRRQGETMPLPFLVRIFREALLGLAYLHGARDYTGESLGLVHRDIAPSNIFLGYDGRTRLIDFGVAKSSLQEALTVPGHYKGKTSYIAPEYLRGAPVDARVDLWSLGVTAWEAIRAQRLFASKGDLVQTLERVLGLTIPTPTRADGEEHPLAEWVMRALERDPESRYQTARAMLEALEELGLPESDYGPWLSRAFQPARDQRQSQIQAALTHASTRHALESEGSNSAESSESGQEVDAPAQKPKSAVSEPPRAVEIVPKTRTSSHRGIAAATLLAALVTAWSLTPHAPVETPGVQRSAPRVSTPRRTPDVRPTHSIPSHTTRPIASAVAAQAHAANAHSMHEAAAQALAADAQAHAANAHSMHEAASQAHAADVQPMHEADAPRRTRMHSNAEQRPRRSPLPAQPDRPRLEGRIPDNPFTDEVRGDERAARGPAASAPAQTAQLSLDAIPWAEVFAEGRSLGTTPLLAVSIPAGALELRLVNDERGLETTVHVQAPPDSHIRRRFRFD